MQGTVSDRKMDKGRNKDMDSWSNRDRNMTEDRDKTGLGPMGRDQIQPDQCRILHFRLLLLWDKDWNKENNKKTWILWNSINGASAAAAIRTERKEYIRIEPVATAKTGTGTRVREKNKGRIRIIVCPNILYLQMKLIKPELLEPQEIEWLNTYHQTCRDK